MEDCNKTTFFDFVICERVADGYECSNDHDCDISASCIRGKCICDPGYEGNGRICFDVDECQPTFTGSLNICGDLFCSPPSY